VRVFFFCVFSIFYKTAQNRPKSIQNAQKTNKIHFVQYSATRCSASFSHSENVVKKTFAKHVQNIAKHPQNTAKHCFSKNTRKTRQNTQKHQKNTAKHHKTHLLTKQTKLANKPLRSHGWTSLQNHPLRQVRPLRWMTAANCVCEFHTMPRCDTDISDVRLLRRSQNETDCKGQSARLETETRVLPSLRDPVVMDQRSAATCPCQRSASGQIEGMLCA